MIKRCVLSVVRFPSKMLNAVTFFRRKVKKGRGVRVTGRMHVYGRGQVVLGNDVKINSCRSANPIGGDTSTVFSTTERGAIIIGDRSGLSNCTIVSKEKVTIGADVKIGGSCRIYDTDFHSVFFEDRIENGDRNAVSKPVEIKDGAFVGAFSIILKGVTIGKHSVIGAGSVVTKNVPDGEIWAGNPAKFIRRIDEKA